MKNEDSFFERVYKVVSRIPTGKVTTYGAIARYIGSPQSSRMVGWALNSSKHNPEHLPAHRVVNRNGLLTGKHHFRTPIMMEQLLESEGINIDNNKIVNFEDHFWDPYVYLD